MRNVFRSIQRCPHQTMQSETLGMDCFEEFLLTPRCLAPVYLTLQYRRWHYHCRHVVASIWPQEWLRQDTAFPPKRACPPLSLDDFLVYLGPGILPCGFSVAASAARPRRHRRGHGLRIPSARTARTFEQYQHRQPPWWRRRRRDGWRRGQCTNTAVGWNRW